MFSLSHQYYDIIYASKGKDYPTEAEYLHALIRRNRRSGGNELLDVACGTGGHIGPLSEHYAVTGLDLDPGMVRFSRERHPGVEIVEGDMIDFDLDRQFDVVVSLFSSIGYTKTVEKMNRAIGCMARHLHPGGVLIVEPWLNPDTFRAGGLHAIFVDEPNVKIARMSVNRVEGITSILEFHYMVSTHSGVSTFVETHETGLFTDDEYLTAFMMAGLETVFDPNGLDGRGLYIGVKPL